MGENTLNTELETLGVSPVIKLPSTFQEDAALINSNRIITTSQTPETLQLESDKSITLPSTLPLALAGYGPYQWAKAPW